MTLMALSMSKNEGMKVKVPAASAAAPAEKKKATATVTVMANGEMFFNKEKVAAPQLSVKLNALKAESKDCQVMVNGDGDASWMVHSGLNAIEVRGTVSPVPEAATGLLMLLGGGVLLIAARRGRVGG